jgi:carbon-monoxide dehydrogenase small subunit
MKAHIQITVNQKEYALEVEPSAMLLEVLRDQLKLKSVHRGCLEGECGLHLRISHDGILIAQ